MMLVGLARRAGSSVFRAPSAMSRSIRTERRFSIAKHGSLRIGFERIEKAA
jgi:hypothetical protein